MIRQHTEKWYRMKAACFGATDVASLLGHGYEMPDQVISNKINYVDSRTRVLEPDFKHLVDRGTRYEPVVKALFASRHDVDVKDTGMKKLASYPWQTASPDGEFIRNGVPCLLEFKVKRTLSESIPYKHWIQMQAQMAVWERKQCVYCQNVVQEFSSEEEFNREIHEFPGVANGVLPWEGKQYYWRLNEFAEAVVDVDPVFWQKTLNQVLIPAWARVEAGRYEDDRKRKAETSGPVSKKRKVAKGANATPIPPPELKVEPHMLNNWFRKDTLLDWLDLYGDASKKSLSANPYIDMIRIKNNEFASIVKTYIKAKYADKPGFTIDIDRLGPEQFSTSCRHRTGQG
jgi:hypothetical protein